MPLRRAGVLSDQEALTAVHATHDDRDTRRCAGRRQGDLFADRELGPRRGPGGDGDPLRGGGAVQDLFPCPRPGRPERGPHDQAFVDVVGGADIDVDALLNFADARPDIAEA